MSYRADSDIFFPYDRFVPLNRHPHPDEIWTEKEVFIILILIKKKFLGYGKDKK
jgi:hypothetical protein